MKDPKYIFAQPYATYRCGFVASQQQTQIKLNPGFYSLSSLSTVPYVTLVGNTGNDKTFSWGEIVYIENGHNARVKNASFHGGDLVLNGGQDYAAMPHRITVPVRMVATANPNEYTVDHVVDARRAVKAWLYTSATALAGGGTFSKEGRAQQRSHDTVSSGAFSGYTSVETLPAGTTALKIALGYSSVSSDDSAMSLLDTASVTLGNVTSPAGAPAYYVLEY